MIQPAAKEVWGGWCAEARQGAEQRWRWVQTREMRRLGAREWLRLLKARLVRLETMGILDYRESQRLKLLNFGELSRPDQDRLRRTDVRAPKNIVGLALAPPPGAPGQSQVDRSLRLLNGQCLVEGTLGLQVLIDEAAARTVGMNIQIRGMDPRVDHAVYLRYDQDTEQMGLGPVSHFCAHWHHGRDPDAPGAEDHDPRLPALIMDPLEVIEILIETFFPLGPASLA